METAIRQSAGVLNNLYFIVDVNAVQLARIADMVERNLVRTPSAAPCRSSMRASHLRCWRACVCTSAVRLFCSGKIVLQVCGRESDSMNPVVAD